MNSIFKPQSTPTGHSWSITSKFGHILKTTEERYGERDKSYILLGLEFTTNGNPQTWYPGNCKYVS